MGARLQLAVQRQEQGGIHMGGRAVRTFVNRVYHEAGCLPGRSSSAFSKDHGLPRGVRERSRRSQRRATGPGPSSGGPVLRENYKNGSKKRKYYKNGSKCYKIGSMVAVRNKSGSRRE